MKASAKLLHLGLYSVGLTLLGLTILTSGALVEDPWGYSFGGYFTVAFSLWALPAFAIFLVSGGIAWAVGQRAEKAGRSWLAFFWLSAAVSPIIMGIIAVTLKPLDSPAFQTDLSLGKTETSLEAKLEELHALKEKGILTDSEFEKVKKKVLGI